MTPVEPSPAAPRGLAEWTEAFATAEIPVLGQTAVALEALREREDSVAAREIAAAVLEDPLMTVKVLAHASEQRGARQVTEVDTVGRTVVLLGVPPFFRAFQQLTPVEGLLAAQPPALEGLLRVVERARAAARFAFDWAVRRSDLGHEEITIAALLHDLAEMLLWCFAPERALRIRHMQAADARLRSSVAQRAVLGIELNELQLALARRWRLPELLVSMMDDRHADQPRVRNVVYAVRLARHAANGWDDAGLPDDFGDVAALLHTTPDRVRRWVGAPDGT